MMIMMKEPERIFFTSFGLDTKIVIDLDSYGMSMDTQLSLSWFNNQKSCNSTCYRIFIVRGGKSQRLTFVGVVWNDSKRIHEDSWIATQKQTIN